MNENTDRGDMGKPLQQKAINAVQAAVRRGDLRPASALDCVDCGNPAREYDHRDYEKPLEVEPVCRGCNIKRGPAKPYDIPPPLPQEATVSRADVDFLLNSAIQYGDVSRRLGRHSTTWYESMCAQYGRMTGVTLKKARELLADRLGLPGATQ